MKSKIFYLTCLVSYIAMVIGIKSDNFKHWYELASPNPESYGVVTAVWVVIIGVMFLVMIASWEHGENQRKFKGKL